MIFTEALLPLLQNSPSPRIVNVSSRRDALNVSKTVICVVSEHFIVLVDFCCHLANAKWGDEKGARRYWKPDRRKNRWDSAEFFCMIWNKMLLQWTVGRWLDQSIAYQNYCLMLTPELLQESTWKCASNGGPTNCYFDRTIVSEF